MAKRKKDGTSAAPTSWCFPVESDKEKYQKYLCSREWAEKREAVRERAGGRCERCRVLPMEACHHLTYARKYNEQLDDLQAICNACHDFTHGKSDFDPKNHSEWLNLVTKLEMPTEEFMQDLGEILFIARGFPASMFAAHRSRVLNDLRLAWNEFAFIETQDSAARKIHWDMTGWDSEPEQGLTAACHQFFHGNACVELSAISFFTVWLMSSCPKPPVSRGWLKYWGRCSNG